MQVQSYNQEPESAEPSESAESQALLSERQNSKRIQGVARSRGRDLVILICELNLMSNVQWNSKMMDCRYNCNTMSRRSLLIKQLPLYEE